MFNFLMGASKNLKEAASIIDQYYEPLLDIVKENYSRDEFNKDVANLWEHHKQFKLYSSDAGWPLNQEKNDPYLASRFALARSEGATDDDIMGWWRLSPIGQFLINKMDRAYRLAMFIHLNKEGLRPEEAHGKVKKTFAVYAYGVPDFNTLTEGDRKYWQSEDRPLPYELHLRIDAFLSKISQEGDLNDLKKSMTSFSSINAFFRSMR